ncbi:MAG: DNA excision repair protein ERCC-2 [Candidatus Thalassarchaeaceae archaeon]|jgi:DNA excision repair protein ERCC-2
MGEEEMSINMKFFAHDTLRPSQKEMLEDGINTLRENGFLLAAAPTGIGKTAASLAAALKISYDSDNGKKILFLTGRQSQHKIVVDTVKSLNEREISTIPDIKLVDIIGREGMCKNIQPLTGECSCEVNIEEGSRKSRRIRLANRILESPMHVEEIIELAEKVESCPWAAARFAAKGARVIVCDYNHVFIENVMELSLPAMGVELENTILIVDEAHNLPDRIRNGLERIVEHRTFEDAYSELEEFLGNKENKLKQIEVDNPYGNKEIEDIRSTTNQLNKLRKEMKKWFNSKEDLLKDEKDMKIETGDFLGEINSILMESLEFKDNNNFAVLRKMINQLSIVKVENDDSIDSEGDETTACSRLGEMLETCLEYMNSSALALVIDKIGEREKIIVRSFLLDPGVVSGPLFEKTSGSIIMSGTLYPPGMYSDILQIPDDRKVIAKEYKSDFLSNRRPILIARDVTTKFTDRGMNNSHNIRMHIKSVLDNTNGNIALFFPSYMMLDNIVNHEGSSWIPWSITHHIIERRMMSKGEVGKKVNKLHESRKKGERCILIGVLGGKFSEGVDYPENILDAVICVGLPLAPPSARQNALKSYYEKRFGNILAWRYSSSQPAVNSLMQAIGRPIRKGEDRALVVLLENRLLNRNYKICMPSSLQIRQTSNYLRTEKFTKSFFEHFPEPAIKKY